MEFQKFNKIPRLNRDIIITEKIDGTNAQIYIDLFDALSDTDKVFAMQHNLGDNADDMFIMAGSRKRYLSLESDNFGFARWVSENAQELLLLGAGRHFGEWWGKGIQRNYGMDRRVFSLFNASKWSAPHKKRPDCCDVVPVIAHGMFSEASIKNSLSFLKGAGSLASKHYGIEFDKPEGIVIFHTHSNHLFKVTIENDEVAKGQVR